MNALVSKTKYAAVWLALLVLLFATWGFSRLDLKSFNIVVAMTIALAKMLLIMLYFMHLRYSERLIWIFAGLGFIWLVIFVDLTLSDYLTRGFSWSQ